MKKLLILCASILSACCGFGAQPPADEILSFVRTKLPDDPLKLTGELQLISRNGHKKSHPVTMELNWGAAVPRAHYSIGNEQLTITWKNDIPSYAFSNPKNAPTSEILGSGMTWADLSFSMLWWPNSKLVDEGKKLNRECYIVEVPVPDSDQSMKLWIEKKMGMLMEAHTLSAKNKQLRRLKIKSIKKMDGMWVAKDLELKNYENGKKTNLRISDLEWKERKPEPQPEPPTGSAFAPVEAVNALTFDLYAQLAKTESGNLFFSPYSISTALAMTYGGARSDTEQELKHALYFGTQGATHPGFAYLQKKLNAIQDQGHVQLSTANSLWPDKNYPFLEDYLAMTKEFYGAEIEAVDFRENAEAARLRINNWVETKTEDRIKNLMEEGSVDSMTRLVLANAIYFKGNWASSFKKEATRNAPFTLASGEKITVPMMFQSEKFKLATTENLQALELPYEGTNLSMVVVLSNPDAGVPDLSSAALNHLKFSKTEVMVHLPKFKMESSFSLAGPLKNLGIKAAFDPQKSDLSGMDGSNNLYISSVAHKAFIEVNEEGTEAAAATGITVGVTSMPPEFIVNRPFQFFIRENSTGLILFMGRVMNPTQD